MFGHIRHVVRLAPVLVLATAVLAPTAGAGRYSLAAPPQAAATQMTRPAATCHQYCSAAVQTRGSQAPATRSFVRRELVPGSAGFRWADAAIGFAVACGGILLVFLIVGAGRRTRIRHVGSAS
jgi:hypothetical protein